MLVLVNGLPLFSQRLVRDLNLFDPKNRYVFTNTYYSKIDKIKFIFLISFTKIVISFNGVSDESGSLNWVIRLKKKLIMQWQGTDVSLAVERYKSNTINKKYIDYATHFTDAPWLKDELNVILKSIEILPFKYIETEQAPEKFPEISVLTYIGKGREEFYGYEIIKDSAKANPGIDFHIIGIDGQDLVKTDNIYFYGWINEEEVRQIMKRIPIFVRLTQHDGNSLVVTEALSYGCEVIWSYPYEKCYLANSIEELNKILVELSEKIKQRNYEPNLDNIKFVKENYNKNQVIGNYIKKINDVANK
jgi:hypothetical protein